MYNGLKVIDVHGHMSTPMEFSNFSVNLVNIRKIKDAKFQLSDERLETALVEHLKIIDERDIDLQMISPRPVHMWHWETPPVQEVWCRTTNDIIAQSVKLHPDRFIGVAQLPQSVELTTENCVDELDRAIKELGFVGAIVNPDPGADGQTPGLDNEDYWYPLYEKAEELGAVLMVHASISRDPRVWNIPQNYQINNVIGQFLSTMQLEHSRVFEDFPNLKVFVCHMGGALNRFIGNDTTHYFGNNPAVKNNLWFDTCVHDREFMKAAFHQKGVDRIMFGTEAPGAGTRARRADDEGAKLAGRPADDLLPVIDSLETLTPEDKLNIFHHNARKFFPLLKEV